MERIDKISDHPLWKWHMAQLKEAEKDRIFCKHGIEHLLDVARIAYIENLEQNCGVSKEWIYTAKIASRYRKIFTVFQGNISRRSRGRARRRNIKGLRI